jgi:hypothetical protein
VSTTNYNNRQKRESEASESQVGSKKKQASRDAIGEDGNWNLKCKECNDEKVYDQDGFYKHMEQT